MTRVSDSYSCLVDWSSSSMSFSLSLSLKSSSWLLDNSSWSFFFSVLAFSQALARVFSFCTTQQHKGTSSVTGTGSECFGGESAGCDRTAPSSQFPVVALIRTLCSPAPPVSPAKAPPQPHSPAEAEKEMSNNTVSSLQYCWTGINTGRHLIPTHTFSSSSTFSADLVDLFKQLADFPLSGGIIIRRPEKKDNTSLAHTDSTESVKAESNWVSCKIKTRQNNLFSSSHWILKLSVWRNYFISGNEFILSIPDCCLSSHSWSSTSLSDYEPYMNTTTGSSPRGGRRLKK